MEEPVLSVSGITKRYGGIAALSDVAFDVQEREICGIIGPNGAGKTTLMECLAGLLPADDGEVRICGSVRPPAARRDALFYLPDGIAAWHDQPVWRVTDLFRRLHGFATEQHAAVLGRLELTGVLTKRVGDLSKGYRRRLLLALALLTPQPILLLDEPFDGLDLRQTLAVMELLREVAQQRALVLSIHQLKDAERICDTLLLLDGGRRLGFGTLTQLAQQAGTGSGDLEQVFLGLTR